MKRSNSEVIDIGDKQVEYLVTAAEMKRYDENTIEQIGIPGMVLMERAALVVFKNIISYHETVPGAPKTAFVLAGTGNNGGDGLAVARLLSEAGWNVTVQWIGKEEKASVQWLEQRKILSHFPVRTGRIQDNAEYTVMVDALFGVGLSREISGEYAEAIEAFNDKNGYKVAVDIPSGICADTGRVLGCAVQADCTVTFGFYKRGHFLYPGAGYAGKVLKEEIGIGSLSFYGQKPELFTFTEVPAQLLPQRSADGNKGTFGKVLLVAGSYKMAGAAILAARAAYRMGAGMVKVISHDSNRVIVQESIPECLYGTPEDLQGSLSWADVIAIGPGLGRDADALRMLKQVLEESNLSLVIDADGLNLLAESAELQNLVKEQGAAGRKIVITPHVGEFARLTGLGAGCLKEDLFRYAAEYANRMHLIVVAKDTRTVVTDGLNGYLNVSGNSGMATAGSGDVLTGMVAGYLAQENSGMFAVCKAVYLHGAAGDYVAAAVGEHACMAGDLIYGIHCIQEAK